MAGTKISAATDGTTVSATDRVPIYRVGQLSSDKFYITAAELQVYLATFGLTPVLTVNPSASNIAITNLPDGVNAQDSVNKRQLDTKQAALQPYNEITTADYVFVLGDAGLIVDRNVASANTVTIPLNATVAFPLGTWLWVNQIGVGVTSWVATGGVTINPSAGSTNLNCIGQLIPTGVRKTGTDTWELFNGLSPEATRAAIYANNFLPTVIKGSSRNKLVTSALTCGVWVTVGALTNTIYCQQMIISEKLTLDEILTKNSAVASQHFRMGLYADNGSCYPGALIYGSAQFASDSATVKTEAISPNITIQPGLYWTAIITDATISFPSPAAASVVCIGQDPGMGSVSPTQGIAISQGYGALPGTAPAGGSEIATGTACPVCAFRAV